MALKIRTSMVFKLSFPNNAILSCIFFYFFIIDLYFLISAVIAQKFIPTVELMIPTRTQTNEANTEFEKEPVIVEARISKFST